MELNKIYQHEDGNIVLAISKDLSPLNREDYMIVMNFNERPPIIWNRQKLKFYKERNNDWLPNKVFPLWGYYQEKYTEIGKLKEATQ